MLSPRPFLRWAGGKQWLARRICELMPRDTATYFEPFLGAGSVFFGALPATAVLGDINDRLIETYTTLRDDPSGVIRWLKRWPNSSSTFYAIRKGKYRAPSRRAAQFIYLNKTCWNGLYRVNRRGQFNVPFGRNDSRPTHDADNLYAVAKALKRVRLIAGDYSKALHSAGDRDFIYLDPPYISAHSDNGFRRYNERIFSWEDQLRLAHLAAELAERGCYVAVSNTNHKDVVSSYTGFMPIQLTRQSLIASSSKYRGSSIEVLLLSPTLSPYASSIQQRGRAP